MTSLSGATITERVLASGRVHHARETFAADLRRGRLELGAARRVSHEDVALLCGDPSLESLDGVLFLDTETTGLGGGAGTFVFLLGVASFTSDGFEVRQWLLPDPAEEEAFLDALAEEAANSRAIVSFHGKGFDLPRLEERCLLAGRTFPLAEHAHVDLLVGARRVFKLRTRRVALQQLEREVLDVRRLDDLPGAECPAAWYDYLRGNQDPMRRVLEHNLLDLLTLPALYAALADVAAGEGPAPDLHGAGCALARTGRRERALGLQRRALARSSAPDLSARVHEEVAVLLRRLGRPDAAAEAAALAARNDPDRPGPWLALAKYTEHRRRDFQLALDYALRLRTLATERGSTARQAAAIDHRISRLERKLACSEASRRHRSGS